MMIRFVVLIATLAAITLFVISATINDPLIVLSYLFYITSALFSVYMTYKITVIILTYQQKQDELFGLLSDILSIGRQIRDKHDS